MELKKFQIVKIDNALMDYECQRLIDLYNTEHVDFIQKFYGFDVEYINYRVEDIVYELTNLDIIHQEPIYIAKTQKNEPIRSDAWEANNPLTEQYGNRIFTFICFLTDGEIFFPRLNLRHKVIAGNALIWNNVINFERTLDALNQISDETIYIKKWVREKPFK